MLLTHLAVLQWQRLKIVHRTTGDAAQLLPLISASEMPSTKHPPGSFLHPPGWSPNPPFLPHPPIKLKTLTGAVSTCMEEMMERLRRTPWPKHCRFFAAGPSKKKICQMPGPTNLRPFPSPKWRSTGYP